MKRWPAVVLACLVATGCGTTLVGEAFRPESYTVRRGDTLYSISWRYGVDHRALMRWNDISDPRSLQPGMRLTLRPGGGSSTTTTTTTTSSRDADPAPVADDDASSPSASAQESAGRDRSRSTDGAGPGTWHWPTDGEVVGTFDDGAVAGRGIDISGEGGQLIHAAAAGEVVYSGSGLKAYGRLLIIRHGGDYLSAYAHNRELLVGEGDRVDAGQRIARMGQSGDGRPLLHFEIRRSGDPVDPMRYLPAR